MFLAALSLSLIRQSQILPQSCLQCRIQPTSLRLSTVTLTTSSQLGKLILYHSPAGRAQSSPMFFDVEMIACTSSWEAIRTATPKAFNSHFQLCASNIKGRKRPAWAWCKVEFKQFINLAIHLLPKDSQWSFLLKLKWRLSKLQPLSKPWPLSLQIAAQQAMAQQVTAQQAVAQAAYDAADAQATQAAAQYAAQQAVAQQQQQAAAQLAAQQTIAQQAAAEQATAQKPRLSKWLSKRISKPRLSKLWLRLLMMPQSCKQLRQLSRQLSLLLSSSSRQLSLQLSKLPHWRQLSIRAATPISLSQALFWLNHCAAQLVLMVEVLHLLVALFRFDSSLLIGIMHNC